MLGYELCASVKKEVMKRKRVFACMAWRFEGHRAKPS
jgi:hypothetical protein